MELEINSLLQNHVIAKQCNILNNNGIVEDSRECISSYRYLEIDYLFEYISNETYLS